MKASAEVVVHDNVKIGYVHIWSYAGEIYQDQLAEELEPIPKSVILSEVKNL